jgi:hypothetical protein
MFVRRSAAGPVATAAELSTSPSGANGTGNAIGPLRARLVDGRLACSFACRCNAGSRGQRDARDRAAVGGATRPRLIIADAGGAQARAVGRRGDRASAVEHGVAGLLAATPACGVRCARCTFTTRRGACEAPYAEPKEEKPPSFTHDCLSYVMITALATRPKFAEAVLVSSGQSSPLWERLEQHEKSGRPRKVDGHEICPAPQHDD